MYATKQCSFLTVVFLQVYDSDGNILQQLDDRYINSVLSDFLKSISMQPPHILDLGCGTGRNTAKLVQLGARVTAVDNSSGMLARARSRVPTSSSSSIKWITHDITSDGSLLAEMADRQRADGVL